MGHNHKIERVARPVLKQSAFGEIRKRMIADPNSDLHAELLGEILRRSNDPSHLKEKVKLNQDRGRNQQIVFVEGVERRGADTGKIILTKPNHDMGVEVCNHRSDQSSIHSDSIAASGSLLACSMSTPSATTG
jgi:hypothetical protein